MNNTVIQSLVRAISILNSFDNNEELGVTEISNLLGLHKSTAYNIITTLERYKYLEKNNITNKYRLGIELFRMGTKVKSGLRRISLPYLERLVAQYKETVNLVIRDGDSVVYLEKIESPYSMRISTSVGGRLPVNATAVGKAILSGLPDLELLEAVDNLNFIKLTDHTICDRNRLLENIYKVRVTGFAEDIEELEVGLTCVAAPIFNYTGKTLAAMSISGPASRMNKAFRNNAAKSLVECTKEISVKLGYHGN